MYEFQTILGKWSAGRLISCWGVGNISQWNRGVLASGQQMPPLSTDLTVGFILHSKDTPERDLMCFIWMWRTVVDQGSLVIYSHLENNNIFLATVESHLTVTYVWLPGFGFLRWQEVQSSSLRGQCFTLHDESLSVWGSVLYVSERLRIVRKQRNNRSRSRW